MANDACKYAPLIFGPQPMDPVSHTRLEVLAKRLGKESVLRVELPSMGVRPPLSLLGF